MQHEMKSQVASEVQRKHPIGDGHYNTTRSDYVDQCKNVGHYTEKDE